MKTGAPSEKKRTLITHPSLFVNPLYAQLSPSPWALCKASPTEKASLNTIHLSSTHTITTKQ